MLDGWFTRIFSDNKLHYIFYTRGQNTDGQIKQTWIVKLPASNHHKRHGFFEHFKITQNWLAEKSNFEKIKISKIKK